MKKIKSPSTAIVRERFGANRAAADRAAADRAAADRAAARKKITCKLDAEAIEILKKLNKIG